MSQSKLMRTMTMSCIRIRPLVSFGFYYYLLLLHLVISVHQVYGFVVVPLVGSRIRVHSASSSSSSASPLFYVNSDQVTATPSNETTQAVVAPPLSDDIHQERIIFGTAALGKAKNPFELLDAAYSKGFHRFDLARTYGGGVSERLFGEWLRQNQIDRNSIDVISKGGMGQDKYGNPNRPLLTRQTLLEEVDASLQALQTDFIDMYMFHRDDLRIPVSQFVLWANELLCQNKIKKWGVSNWSLKRIQEAYEFCVENGLEPPSANSPQFSLAVPQCEVWPTTESISNSYQNDIQWYQDHNMELLCWEVLAKGFMAKPHLWNAKSLDTTSLLNGEPEIGSDEWRLYRIQKAYCYPENYHRRQLALQLSKQLGYKLSQIATLYPLSMGSNVSVIFGSNNLMHLNDMVGLGNVQLDKHTKEQLAKLAATSASSSSKTL